MVRVGHLKNLIEKTNQRNLERRENTEKSDQRKQAMSKNPLEMCQKSLDWKSLDWTEKKGQRNLGRTKNMDQERSGSIAKNQKNLERAKSIKMDQKSMERRGNKDQRNLERAENVVKMDQKSMERSGNIAKKDRRNLERAENVAKMVKGGLGRRDLVARIDQRGMGRRKDVARLGGQKGVGKRGSVVKGEQGEQRGLERTGNALVVMPNPRILPRYLLTRFIVINRVPPPQPKDLNFNLAANNKHAILKEHCHSLRFLCYVAMVGVL